MQCPTPNPLIFESDVLDEHVNALQGDRPIALFGLKALNGILGGVYPGQAYAIGAGPGSGKTTLASQEADKLAADGHPVVYVSSELPAHKLLEKSLARLSDNGLALSEVSNAATVDHPKHEVFEAALNAYRDCIAPNLCITGPLNTVELSNLVGLMARERNEAPIVFVDYLQLLACGVTAGQQFLDERLAITACVKGLREISNLYGSPVIALSSTTRRSYESGKSSRPNLGMFGVESFTPIINQPDAAILGVNCTASTPYSSLPVTMGNPTMPLSRPQSAPRLSSSLSRTVTARWVKPDSISTGPTPLSSTGVRHARHQPDRAHQRSYDRWRAGRNRGPLLLFRHATIDVYARGRAQYRSRASQGC